MRGRSGNASRFAAWSRSDGKTREHSGIRAKQNPRLARASDGPNGEVLMALTARPSASASRRQFLKAAAAGAATSMIGLPRGYAAEKSLTLLHESSFIKT